MLAAIANLPSYTPPWCEPRLPDTGAASGQLFVVGLTFVVVGCGLLLLARRVPAVASAIAALALVAAVGVPRADAAADGACPGGYVSVPVLLNPCTEDELATDVTYGDWDVVIRGEDAVLTYVPGWTRAVNAQVVGGQPPYTFSATGLTGYALDPTSGAITQVDAAPGVTSFTLKVTDQRGRSFSVPASVNWIRTYVADFQYPVPGRTVDGPPVGQAGGDQWGTAPYTFAAQGLTGYVVDAKTGKITWDGATAATTSGAINVTDAAGAAITIPTEVKRSTVYTLKTTQFLSLNTYRLDGVKIDGWGTGPYTYSATDLPGWTIDSQSGTLTYSPPEAIFDPAARVVGTVTVTDSTGATVNIPVSLQPEKPYLIADC